MVCSGSDRELRGPTSRHLRFSIFKNTLLFLHFLGVTGAPLSAFSFRDFRNLQYLPATFAFLGGNPGVTPGVPFETSFTFRVVAFCDFQKHITFLYFSEVTPPPSQHFRVAILRICNASRLLLHFCGVTPGNPWNSVRDLPRFSCDWILRFS